MSAIRDRPSKRFVDGLCRVRVHAYRPESDPQSNRTLLASAILERLSRQSPMGRVAASATALAGLLVVNRCAFPEIGERSFASLFSPVAMTWSFRRFLHAISPTAPCSIRLP